MGASSERQSRFSLEQVLGVSQFHEVAQPLLLLSMVKSAEKVREKFVARANLRYDAM